MTKILADALVPIFAGLLLGYCAGLWRKMDNENVKTLITFVMSFAIPCSLFMAIAGTSRAALRSQAAPGLVLAIVYFVLYGLSFLWTRSKENLNNADSSVVALTLGFPNSAAVGLPLLGSVFGPQATVTVATSIAIGSLTVSPITLALLESNGNGARGGGRAESFCVFRSALLQEAHCLGSAAWIGVFLCSGQSSLIHPSIACNDGIRIGRISSRADGLGRLRSEIRNGKEHACRCFS
jgi:predicted permease